MASRCSINSSCLQDTKLLGHSNLLKAPLVSIKWGLAKQPACAGPSSGEAHSSEAGRGGKWEKQKPSEGGRKNTEKYTHGSPGGGICVNLPVHKPDLRNHRSMTHTHTTPTHQGSFGNVLGFFVCLVFFAFIFKDRCSFFICPHNENRIFKCLKYTYITDAHTFQKS